MSDELQFLIAQNKSTRAPSLDLSHFELDELPQALAELRWLQHLTLPGFNSWAPEVYGHTDEMARERKSELFSQPRHRRSYAMLAALPELRSMRLRAEDISGIGVVAGLAALTLSGIAKHLDELAQLQNLRALRLYQVSVRASAGLRRLRQLDELMLHHCSRDLLADVSALTQLRSLEIRRMGTTPGAAKEFDLAALRGFSALETLRLPGSDVADLAGLRDLPSLRELDVSYTSIADISPLSNLSNLEELNATCTSVVDLQPLRHLKRLRRLQLHRTLVSDLSPLSELTELVHFDASETDVTSLVPLQNSRSMQTLDVSSTPISSLSGLQELTKLGSLDISRTGVRDLAPLRGATQLTFLNAGSTPVDDLSPMQSLTALQILNATRTQVADLTPLRDMKELHALNLWRTKVSDLSPLRQLTKLRALNASETRVSDLMPLRRHIEEGVKVSSSDNYNPPGFFFYKCPLTSPPVEIVDRGAEAILNYFVERDRGAIDHLYEAKLLIVGDGGAGKTSLVRRLYQPERPLPREGETTKGIDIHRHDFTLKNGRRFRLNIWDFGGQEIYHATHQFFLTRRSLYVLVDDTRTSDKSVSDPRFKYWLELIDLFAGHSPTLIFQNEKGGRTKQIDLAGIRGEYENVKDRYGGNLEQLNSVDSLRDAIEYFAGTLDHVGDELPASWLKVRADIEARAQQCPYIPQQEYFEIYGRHMEFDRARALHLSRYLHDLGVFLHFQADPLLGRIVILQNHWATEAVFRVLDDEVVKAQRGRFTRTDCNRLWHDAHYADLHPELLALMQSFELCYELPDCRPPAWLAPQLLPPGKPSVLSDWTRTDDLVLGYHYEFLPKGIISRLTVRLNRFVLDPQKAWVTGVLFERETTSVLVELLATGKDVQLRARGPDRKALLSVIAADIDALNGSFEGLRGRVSKRIPCVCRRCRETRTPEVFDERQLMRRKEDGKIKVECPVSYEAVSVLEMLDGFRNNEPDPSWTFDVARAPTTIRIFLASSAELRADRDEFDLYFRQLNDRLRAEGVYLEIVRWENFLDAMSETRLQDEYNKAVAACDVFVSLFFTKTGQFTEEEFDVAHRQFAAAGKPAIYTFFKDAEIRTGNAPASDLQCLWAFQKKLQQLGHFYTMYNDIEHLKRQFRDQLDRLISLGIGGQSNQLAC